ncbi:Regulatory protein RecX [Linum perenne]
MASVEANFAFTMFVTARNRLFSYLLPQSIVKINQAFPCHKVRCCSGSSGPVRYIPKKSSRRNEEEDIMFMPLKDCNKSAFDKMSDGAEKQFSSNEKNLGENKRYKRLPTAQQAKVHYTSAVVDYEAMEKQVEFSMDKGIQISGHAQENQLVEDANKLAIKFLARRALTALELKKKLHGKKCPADIVDSVVASLQHRGYVNDSLYAESFARSRWSSLSWGPMRIKQALLKKGVSEGDAQNAIRNVFQGTEPRIEESRVELSNPSLDHLLAQASKQWGRSQDVAIEKRKSRMIRWLQYRGFDWSVISTVLGKLESGKPP